MTAPFVEELLLDAHDSALELLRLAYKEALRSPDPSTQNGVLICQGRKILQYGHNHFPEGVRDDIPERWERPAKYGFIEHGERDAVYAAAREGTATCNGTMYACWAACDDCARAIIGAGITEVYTHLNSLAETRFGIKVNETWKAPIIRGITMFNEAKIPVYCVTNKLFQPGELEILFQGEKCQP